MTILHGDIGRATILGGLRFVLPVIGYAFFYPILLQKSGAEVLGLWSLFATFSIYINLTDVGFSQYLVREAVTTRPVKELRRIYENYLAARRSYLIVAPALIATMAFPGPSRWPSGVSIRGCHRRAVTGRPT